MEINHKHNNLKGNDTKKKNLNLNHKFNIYQVWKK